MRKKLDKVLEKIRSRCDRIKSQVQGGLDNIVFCGGKTLVYLRAFALRLNWYKYFIGNCIIAISATSFGFALGALLTVIVYDDGLERVMDVYNYFKRPPRS